MKKTSTSANEYIIYNRNKALSFPRQEKLGQIRTFQSKVGQIRTKK